MTDQEREELSEKVKKANDQSAKNAGAKGGGR